MGSNGRVYRAGGKVVYSRSHALFFKDDTTNGMSCIKQSVDFLLSSRCSLRIPPPFFGEGEMKKVLLTTAVTLVLAITSCGLLGEEEEESTSVTFGYHTTWEVDSYYSFDDSETIEDCFDKAVVDAVAAQAGLSVTYAKIATSDPFGFFGVLAQSLENDEIDVAFGLLFARSDRETQVDFTSVYLPASESQYDEPIAFAVKDGAVDLKSQLDSNGTIDDLRLEYGVESN
jgi:hypothetical protein